MPEPQPEQIPPNMPMGTKLPLWLIVLQSLSCVSLIALAIYITIWHPGFSYPPVTRNVLYLLVSIPVGILLGSTSSAILKLTDGKTALTLVGSYVLVLVTFYVLVKNSAPEEQMAAFEVVDQNGAPITLEGHDQVRFGLGMNAIQTTPCIKGNQLLVVFPEQLVEIPLTVEHPPGSRIFYKGKIGYTGTRTYTIKLGKQLIEETTANAK